LHGIPLGIKDIIDVKGFATQAGSPLRKDCLAAEDSPLVAALRRAGAIILGKTVTVEFACFDPSPTRNPWDPTLRHTPGGSSSGSAAAAALGMCLGALGTQTGGSLVRPASYCGIATCKPSYGLLSTEGVVPVSHHLDHPGPMARRVADLKLMLSALLPQLDWEPPQQAAPPRLGLVDSFFMQRADAAVSAEIQAAVAKLRAAGAIVEPVQLDLDFDRLLEMHWRIMAAEAAEYHRRDFAAHRSSYGPMISSLLDFGLALPAVEYVEALVHQRRLKRRAVELVGNFDALIMPATNSPAPPRLDTTGTRDFQAPWTYAGLPVVSIPCGLADDRMPVAVQLVARPNDDVRLLGLAAWCEARLEFNALPPWLA
jgi:aspartyl-tRNA(Asn)/glutamyl-tRNA(Gln) amidotransferase subunit A